MPAPIHILHFADLHFGAESFGASDPATGLSLRALDVLARLDEAVAFARDKAVDLVLFAGDAFHSSRPNPTYQRALAGRMLSLSAVAPVMLLLGDRDLPASATAASPLDMYQALNVPNIHVAREFGVQRIPTANGDLVLATAPSPQRSTLLPPDAALPKSASQSDALSDTLNVKLAQLAAEADGMAGDGLPRLLLGHFAIGDARPGSETRFTLGRDVKADLKPLTRAGWDYVALGHVHRHQNLTEGQAESAPVVYAGGMERLDFAEADEAKGFCSIQLSRGKATWRFVEVDARKRLSLKIDCREAENPTRAVLDAMKQAALAGAIVRLDIRLTSESEARFKDSAIKAALKRADVFHVAGIAKAIEREEKTRLGGDAAALDELELLQRYFQNRGISHDRQAELIERARLILAEDQASRATMPRLLQRDSRLRNHGLPLPDASGRGPGGGV